ncbi:hypothetical protein [Clostridium ganghwense]|uniref:Uncharacterized protein n=1 Tax=Clostridium ganghwense TaxID=312089 RepID=A0ABT4CPJ1_9CLOT|nr:hypothetical protein [Clostridium ganghwense]MCY6370975.1 hypothetical protein [Clostridium ganghwense]
MTIQTSNNTFSRYEEITRSEIASNIKATYDENYIVKSLFSGKTRDELAKEFNHKSYRTLDMFMRRRGYVWNSVKQNYVIKPLETPKVEINPSTFKVEKIISLFAAGLEPIEIAKKVGMRDHRTIAMYMKDKGYIWSSEKQNYVLLKGEQPEVDFIDDSYEEEIAVNSTSNDFSPSYYDNFSNDFNNEELPQMDRFQKLIPMLEMIDRNKDKLAELLSINTGGTIPRYVVGGITITKSLCMSHNLAELIKDFSKEKNISQREIFEVAVIEFLKKYGYEIEVNALFTS